MQQKSEGKFPRFFCCAMMARPIRAPATAQRRIFPRGGEIFSLPVARWGATFCSFRGIGEGGTAAPLGFFCRGREPQHPPMRGGQSPPLRSTHGEGAPPLRPRVTFSPDEKVTKESPRGDIPSGDSPEGDASLPLRQAATPSIGFQTQQKTDLPLWVGGQIGLVFSFGFFGETFPAVNPWHGR